MKILKQFAVILGICLAAEALVSILPFSFPGSVAAIIILAVLLAAKILKEEQIQETGDFFLANMAIVFVPISVGMIYDLKLLKGQMAGFLLVVIVSLILTFLGTYVTVKLVQMCIKKLNRKGGGANE